jgi:hypothetical protein
MGKLSFAERLVHRELRSLRQGKNKSLPIVLALRAVYQQDRCAEIDIAGLGTLPIQTIAVIPNMGRQYAIFLAFSLIRSNP